MDSSLVCIKRQLKRAKVFEIQKIVRQIRMLHNRKGTDVQLHKSQRKVKRLLEVLEVLKNLNLGCIAEDMYQTLQEGGMLPNLTSAGVHGSTLSSTERAKHRLLTNKTFQRHITTMTEKGSVRLQTPHISVQQTAVMVDTSDGVHTHQTNIPSRTCSEKSSIEVAGMSSDSPSSTDGEKGEENEHGPSLEHDTTDSSEDEICRESLKTRTIRGTRRDNQSRRLKLLSDDHPVNRPLLESTFVRTLSEDSAKKLSKKSARTNKPEKHKMNRPGQRSRQKQWEKIYGEKAKHVRGSRKQKMNGVRGRGKTKSRNNQRKSKALFPSHSLGISDSSKPQLHPSWEAQRKRKAKEAGIPEFQGQRTVFSD